jgi:hypothetical protein
MSKRGRRVEINRNNNKRRFIRAAFCWSLKLLYKIIDKSIGISFQSDTCAVFHSTRRHSTAHDEENSNRKLHVIHHWSNIKDVKNALLSRNRQMPNVSSKFLSLRAPSFPTKNFTLRGANLIISKWASFQAPISGGLEKSRGN